MTTESVPFDKLARATFVETLCIAHSSMTKTVAEDGLRRAITDVYPNSGEARRRLYESFARPRQREAAFNNPRFKPLATLVILATAKGQVLVTGLERQGSTPEHSNMDPKQRAARSVAHALQGVLPQVEKVLHNQDALWDYAANYGNGGSSNPTSLYRVERVLNGLVDTMNTPDKIQTHPGLLLPGTVAEISGSQLTFSFEDFDAEAAIAAE